MQLRKHYSHAPITEAVINLQAQLSPEVNLDILSRMYSSIQAEYPKRENMLVLQGEMMGGASVAAKASQSHIGYRVLSSDEKYICQLRLDGFAFSRLAPYDCWEIFRDEAKRLWSIYNSLTNPQSINRVGLRYINRIDIPLPFGDLQEYLRTFPEVSADLSPGLSGYFMQLQIPQENLAGMLVLNQAIVPSSTEEIISILLDLDFFVEQNISNPDTGIWDILEQMHTQNNQAFEACITERTRELIQ